MKPPPFDYVAARNLDEALDALARGGPDARVIAGGQSLLPLLALRLARPSLLVDINRVPGLAGAQLQNGDGRSAPGALRVGAMTRQSALLGDATVAKELPVLAQAAGFVGHFQTRNRGTLGGSIALADPASELPALALALDATLEVRSKKGKRTLKADGFFQGSYSTALEPGEIITAIAFPKWKQGSRLMIDEVMRRPGDFALVGLALGVEVEGGRIARAALAWFGMGQTPLRAGKAEKALAGQSAAKLDCDAIGRLATEDCEPWDDVHATAGYRRLVGARLAARMLREATGAKA
jgi:carbon-monoxide dehydrogenase medium subunit